MVWQVIKRLLGNALPWLLAALLGFGVYQYTVAKRYAAERDTAQQQADMLRSALAWQKSQAEAMSAALSERDARLAEIADSMGEQRNTLDTLERNDEPTRDWSAEPVPDGVGDWVRKLSASDPDA